MNGTVAELEQQACEWIRGLQRDHGATATPLPEKRREHLALFFPPPRSSASASALCPRSLPTVPR
jgi:hypothetical protein